MHSTSITYAAAPIVHINDETVYPGAIATLRTNDRQFNADEYVNLENSLKVKGYSYHGRLSNWFDVRKGKQLTRTYVHCYLNATAYPPYRFAYIISVNVYDLA